MEVSVLLRFSVGLKCTVRDKVNIFETIYHISDADKKHAEHSFHISLHANDFLARTLSSNRNGKASLVFGCRRSISLGRWKMNMSRWRWMGTSDRVGVRSTSRHDVDYEKYQTSGPLLELLEDTNHKYKQQTHKGNEQFYHRNWTKYQSYLTHTNSIGSGAIQ